ncbi:MAG: ATP-binding protein [Gemmatimonadaceae bacterium]|nr:ATP-binding protein [Gemmatimonadaceae bacterium]
MIASFDRRTVPIVLQPDCQVVQHLPVPAWVYDRATLRFLYVNDAAIAAYGYTADEFATMTLRDIRPPDEIRHLQRALDETPVGRRVTGPYRHRRKDGSTFMVDIHADDLVFDGSAARVVVAMDVTHRLEVERRLADAARSDALAEIAGGVAHDINNMLASIGAFAELLDDDPARTAAEHADLMEIRGAVRRASVLARRFVQIARAQEPRLADVDLGALVADLEPMLRRLLPPRIALELRVEATPPVTIDPVHVEQVVLNLVVNARDAIAHDGRIVVALGPGDGDAGAQVGEPSAVVLRVTDSGAGMPPEVMARVFEPFFTTKANGTGFGLATTRRHVHQAGGIVSLDSTIGTGTTVRVIFPPSPGAGVA